MIGLLIGCAIVVVILVICWFAGPWLDCEKDSRGGLP